jgi:hypothetical protein
VFCRRHPQFAEALKASETDEVVLKQALEVLNKLSGA